MAALFARYEALKRRVGGNREKLDFEWTFGLTAEEQQHITPPNRMIVRTLSQIDFGIKLSNANGNRFDAEIDRALSILENTIVAQGVLPYDALRAAEEELLPLSPAAKEYEVLFAAHAHIDMDWMWGWQETVAVTIATFRTILNLMCEYPEFTYSQSQSSVYKIVEDFAPELMDEIKARIREGRWEVTASAWVETDKNMPDTESLVRHIEYTRNYLESTWGIARDDIELDFSPDTFGHSRFVPEINTFGGLKYYYHCRGLQDDLTLYRYKCPSGAELLMYKEPYWYNSGVTPDCGTGIFTLAERCAGLKTGLVVYGVGDHGGGPSRRDIERILEMRDWPVFPTMKFGTIKEFFKKAEHVRDRLPIVDRELNAIFAGCYTTQSRIKRGNRKAEQALLEAEKLAAFDSMLTGAPVQAKRLEKAWQGVLFTHFHDIITGSCVQESREHAMALYADALAHAQTVESGAARSLAEQIDTSAFSADPDIRFTLSEGAGVGFGLSNHGGVPNPERGAGKTRIYTVFNAGASAKKGLVELTIWDYTGDLRGIEVVDSRFAPLRFQLIDQTPLHYWAHSYVRLLVEVDVRAFGYTTLAVREKAVEDYPTFFLRADRTEQPKGDVTLENESLTACIDGRTGALTSLFDRATGAELLRAPAGLCVVETEHNGMSAWTIGRYLSVEPVTHAIKITPFAGELRSGVEMEHKMLGSTVKTVISLDTGAKALKYAFTVDWHESGGDRPTIPALIYRMPVANAATEVLMDVPGGAITRTARAMDLPALSYAAACGAGNAPVIVTDSKYGYRLDRGDLIATLINSATYPDPYPERGIHAIELYLAAETACPKALYDLSKALLKPMLGLPTWSHAGALPADGALMRFDARTSALSSLAWDGGVVKARVYETAGEADRITMELPVEIASATVTDLEGNELAAAEVSGKTASFALGAHRIAQLNLAIKG
ncbi:MAG: glycoside hydrolase family 38 C-terminal domain-containing protein [Christensenellales bacterium]